MNKILEGYYEIVVGNVGIIIEMDCSYWWEEMIDGFEGVVGFVGCNIVDVYV